MVFQVHIIVNSPTDLTFDPHNSIVAEIVVSTLFLRNLFLNLFLFEKFISIH